MYNFKNENKIKYTEFCCEYCLTEEILTALQLVREIGRASCRERV